MANLSSEWNEIDWVVETAQKEGTNYFRRFEDWYREKQTQESMEQETRRVSTLHRQIGWSEGKNLKRIASMPTHVFSILRQIDPEFGRNSKEGKAKMYRFLARHPMFSVR